MSNFAFNFSTRTPTWQQDSAPSRSHAQTSRQPLVVHRAAFEESSPVSLVKAPERPMWGTIAPRHFDFADGTDVKVMPESKIAGVPAFREVPNAVFKAVLVLGDCSVELSAQDSSKVKHFPNGVVLVDTRTGVFPIPAEHFGAHFTLSTGEPITSHWMVNLQSPRK